MKKLSVFLIFVSVALIGFGGYLYFNSPKNQMLSVIASQIDKMQKEQKIVEKEKAQYITNTTLKSGDILLGSLDGDIYVDENVSKSYYKLALNLAEELGKVGDLPIMYIEGNRLYIKVDKETYYIDIFDSKKDTSSSSGSSSSEDAFEILLSAAIKKIPDGNFTKEDSKVQVIGSSYDAVKYSVYLTGSDMYNICESVLNEIYNNSKLKIVKEAVSNFGNKDQILEDLKEGLSSYGKDEKVLTYTIYVKDDVILKHEVTAVGNTIDNSERADLAIELSKAERKTDLYDYELIVKYSSQNVLEASISGESTLRKISVKYAGSELEGTYSENNNNKTLTMSLYDESNKTTPMFTLSYNYSEVVADSEYEGKLNITLYLGTDKVVLDCSYKKLLGKDIPSFDTSSAKEYIFNSSGGELNEYFENMITNL